MNDDARLHAQVDRIVRTIDNLRLRLEQHPSHYAAVLARLDAAYAHSRGARDILECRLEQREVAS
jgi:hypothetical protein